MDNDKDFSTNERRSAVIVAHPDDETLWVGGLVLMSPAARWHIVTLCRGSDADRAPKFARVLTEYGATGAMGDLDDGPDQTPLEPAAIENAILSLLESRNFDLILTHSPAGEYTRHRRHEETARAVIALLHSNRLSTRELRLFAYEDNSRRQLPKPIPAADVQIELSEAVWRQKYEVMTNIYGFGPESWEAKTTPKTESFWRFTEYDRVEQTIREKRSRT